MKRIFLLFAILLMVSTAFAGTAKLAWDPSPSPEVTGYRVYYDQDGSAPWEYNQDMGQVLTYDVTDLQAGTWHFTVTAYSPTAESVGSNVVNGDIPAYTPPVDNLHPPIVIPQPPGGTVTIQIIVE